MAHLLRRRPGYDRSARVIAIRAVMAVIVILLVRGSVQPSFLLAQSADGLQWTAPNAAVGARTQNSAAETFGAPRLIADLPPAVPDASAVRDMSAGPVTPLFPATPNSPYSPTWPGRSDLAAERDGLSERLDRSPSYPEVARTPAEFPTHLPQDDYPDLPPNLPSAVEDDDLLIVGRKMSAYKSGFFQKLSIGGTWLPGAPEDGLGIVESEAFLTVAVPAPKREWPLLITPYLNIRSLDGPVSPDLPPLLYETYVDFMWVPKLSPRWTGILAVAPSVYSSFQEGVESGFRWTGKGLLRYELHPETLHLMAGVLLLNRDDIRLLPAGGILWKPNADIDYEIVFPRPKLAHRIRFTDEWADWWYLAGEFGGNSFAIVRADGSPDQATLRDIRVMFGLERRRDGGGGTRFEIGYVFNRSVEYRSDTPDFHPDDTVLMRFTAMW